MKILNFLPSLPLLSLLVASPSCTSPRAPDAPTQSAERARRFVLTVKADEAALGPAVERTAQVINKRCELLKVECKLGPAPGGRANQLALDVADELSSERVREVLLARGLEMRAAVSPPFPAPLQLYGSWAEAQAAAAGDEEVVPYEEGGGTVGYLVVKRRPVITGEHARDPGWFVVEGTTDEYDIHFGLNLEGSNRLGEWTDANINRYLAVLYNGRAVAVPYIKAAIYESGEINGRFTRERAEEVALMLRGGHLPAPVEASEETTRRP